jgi:hypothetical protein
MKEKQTDFERMHSFIQGQQSKLEEVIEAINASKISDSEKKKKIRNAEIRLLDKEVNMKAVELKTCCIHMKPVDYAQVFATCSLHLETNEWLRFMKAYETHCGNITLNHHCCKTLEQQMNKKGGITVPNIACCEEHALSSPLSNFLANLKANGLRKYAMRIEPRYKERTSDDSPGETKVRLIGENVERITSNFSRIFCVLQGAEESQIEKQKRVVFHGYGHLLRCFGALLGQYVLEVKKDIPALQLISGLLVKLVYRFDLHFSLNTLYLTKINAFLVTQMSRNFRISATHCLGFGVVGLTQGGEHLNKKIKTWSAKWTSGRPGYIKDLLNQLITVFLGGMTKFKEMCPPEVDIFKTEKAWQKRFPSGGPDLLHACACCGATVETHNLHTFLRTFAEHKIFQAESVAAAMEANIFQDSGLSYADAFKIGLRFRATDSDLYCANCCDMFKLFYALLKDKDHLLAYSNCITGRHHLEDVEQHETDYESDGSESSFDDEGEGAGDELQVNVFEDSDEEA